MEARCGSERCCPGAGFVDEDDEGAALGGDRRRAAAPTMDLEHGNGWILVWECRIQVQRGLEGLQWNWSLNGRRLSPAEGRGRGEVELEDEPLSLGEAQSRGGSRRSVFMGKASGDLFKSAEREREREQLRSSRTEGGRREASG